MGQRAWGKGLKNQDLSNSEVGMRNVELMVY
jgi:hypothetical protein